MEEIKFELNNFLHSVEGEYSLAKIIFKINFCLLFYKRALKIKREIEDKKNLFTKDILSYHHNKINRKNLFYKIKGIINNFSVIKEDWITKILLKLSLIEIHPVEIEIHACNKWGDTSSVAIENEQAARVRRPY